MKDRGLFSRRRLISSFKYAFQGLGHAVKNEKNLQIHLIAAVLAVVAGIVLKINKIEWLFVAFSILGIWALELMNTAIERAVDLITDDYKPLAKQAKDLAAAAVLVFAFFTVIVGAVIFLPKIIQLLN